MRKGISNVTHEAPRGSVIICKYSGQGGYSADRMKVPTVDQDRAISIQ